MKVLSVVGARPQFVKAFAVSAALGAHDHVLVHTGQHYDEELSDVFFEELGIPEPAYNLAVGSDTHARQTARMLSGIDTVVAGEDPDVVLAYGDTNSTLATALSVGKRPVPLAHVEAGLRSHRWEMPEEVNRVLTDHSSDLLFAPSQAAVDALAAEGIDRNVHRCGDVMYDAVLRVRARAGERSSVLDDLGLAAGEYVVATVHRARNTDDPNRLASILDGLAEAPHPVVFPVHPRTAAALDEHGLTERAERRLTVVDPLGYLDFVTLVDDAARVATDSGGVQKEAFFLDVPCVTLREETEWVETVEAGWNVLVGADRERVARALAEPEVPSPKPSLYGDGEAAERIVSTLETFASGGDT